LRFPTIQLISRLYEIIANVGKGEKSPAIAGVVAETPPFNLLLGKAGMKNARLKLDELKHGFDVWAETSEGADFPESQRSRRDRLR